MIFYIAFIIFSKIILSKSDCLAGINLCARCHPITKLCVQCEKDIYIPDSKGGCENSKKCVFGKNHCVECLEDGYLCKECDIGYFKDENGGCSITDNCEISYKGECLKCKENFVLVGSKDYYGTISDYPKICKSLNTEDLQNCKSISDERGTCLECQNGYYFSSQDKKCITEQNCAKSSFGNCLYCNNGYYLNKKQQKCIKAGYDNFLYCKISNDGTKCDECIDDYYFDQNGICVYSNFCAEGQSYSCNKCIDGYYLTSYGSICTTEKNCYSGRKDIGICTQCTTNYCIDFKDGKCKSNQEDNDLKYCMIADGECKECYYGKYLGQDKKCSNSRNCLISDKGICSKCEDNYYLGLDYKCTNVEHCIYSDDYFNCIECDGKFYYDRKNNTCSPAEGKFENCKIGYGNSHCEKCKDGFYIDQSNTLCFSNNEQNEFYKCEISNGQVCIQCTADYYLGYLDRKCTLVPYCDIIENSERCLVCSDTYCLDAKTGFCEDNDIIHDLDKMYYYRCNRTNAESNACELCLEGYELRDGLCFDEQHCAERNEDGTCKRCERFEDEYYEQCISEVFGCVEGYYDPFCLECNNLTDVGECTKCMNGYHFDDNYNCEEDEEVFIDK